MSALIALTPSFVVEQGFKYTSRVKEEEFYYEKYVHQDHIGMVVWFNYYNDGRTTYDFEFEGCDFCNVGQVELLALLRMI